MSGSVVACDLPQAFTAVAGESGDLGLGGSFLERGEYGGVEFGAFEVGPADGLVVLGCGGGEVGHDGNGSTLANTVDTPTRLAYGRDMNMKPCTYEGASHHADGIAS